MRFLFLFLLLPILCHGSAVDEALRAAKISANDPLPDKITKILALINRDGYYEGKSPRTDHTYHLDSLRTAEEVLAQKIGGHCGSAANVLAAMLMKSGVPASEIRILPGVMQKDLTQICPRSGSERSLRSPAQGHVFVAVRFPGGWKLINPTHGPRRNKLYPWMSPEELQKKMAAGKVAVPKESYNDFPEDLRSDNLILFASWSPSEVPLHTFEERFNLIASGTKAGKICDDIKTKQTTGFR